MNKFPVLNYISNIMFGLSAIVALISIFAAIAYEHFAPLGGLIVALLLAAFSELIGVLICIERNTRQNK